MPDSDFHKQPTLPDYEDSAKTPDEKIPEKIGPYAIEALIDKGGMNFLYLGLHPDTNDPIMIKTLSPRYVSHPDIVERFLREAEIIALADHPNIIKLLGQGQWEGGLYIAMEFIQGISLREYLAYNLISLKHALEIVMEIAVALCHLHAHGVIHRDLKPENILITASGSVKVIDFGISQLLTEERQESPSQKLRLIGTPIYMSPEQKNNPESTSFPSDIYSLAIITYELVLGKLSLGQIHLSIMPKGLQKILSKALQPEPINRYQDVVDFMTDLATYMNSKAFLKENKENASVNDLSESLRKAQNSLVPQEAPHWPNIDISFAKYKNIGIPSLYYDFLELPHQAYGIIIGQPSIKGSPGIVYASGLRGMVRALCQLTQKPEEMATILNSLLINDSMQQKFAFSYLILLPLENKCRFISCGCGHLLHIPKGQQMPIPLPSQHESLGTNPHAHFVEQEFSWEKGSSLFLYAFSNDHPSVNNPLYSEEQFQNILAELSEFSPQTKVETILRKAKIHLSRSSNESSIFILSLLRT